MPARYIVVSKTQRFYGCGSLSSFQQASGRFHSGPVSSFHISQRCMYGGRAELTSQSSASLVQSVQKLHCWSSLAASISRKSRLINYGICLLLSTALDTAESPGRACLAGHQIHSQAMFNRTPQPGSLVIAIDRLFHRCDMLVHVGNHSNYIDRYAQHNPCVTSSRAYHNFGSRHFNGGG